MITFGCSWTYGMGLNYTQGMNRDDYQLRQWDSDFCDQMSFRALLAKKYQLTNKNFSSNASSNQRQFRLAKHFFCSYRFEELADKFDQIVVLWGLTSTARNEMYFNSTQGLENFLYSNNRPESKVMIKYFYDHDNEINELTYDIALWNEYFAQKNIKNLWFDTFNHHDYPTFRRSCFRRDYISVAGPAWPKFEDYENGINTVPDHIKREIDEVYQKCKENNDQPDVDDNLFIFNSDPPRDLLSKLAIKNGLQQLDDRYHYSNWEIDSNRVKYLVDLGILNPYSHHPTQLGHQQIADLLAPYIESVLT